MDVARSNPYPAALLAVLGFGASEALMNEALKVADSATVLCIRILISLPVVWALFAFSKHSCSRQSRAILNPLHWLRALMWVMTATLLAASFTANRELTGTYALFLAHPLWTLLLTPLVTNHTVNARLVTFPLLMLGFGLASYMYGKTGHWPGVGPFVLPLLAGGFFAMTNLLTAKISEELGHSSITTTFFTTAIASLAIPVVLWVVPPVSSVSLHIASDTSLLRFSVTCCAFAVLDAAADLAETYAFSKAGPSTTNVAMCDLLVLPIGIVFDYFLAESFDPVARLVSFEGFGVLLLMIASFIAIRRSDPQSSSHYSNGALTQLASVATGTTSRGLYESMPLAVACGAFVPVMVPLILGQAPSSADWIRVAAIFGIYLAIKGLRRRRLKLK